MANIIASTFFFSAFYETSHPLRDFIIEINGAFFKLVTDPRRQVVKTLCK